MKILDKVNPQEPVVVFGRTIAVGTVFRGHMGSPGKPSIYLRCRDVIVDLGNPMRQWNLSDENPRIDGYVTVYAELVVHHNMNVG